MKINLLDQDLYKFTMGEFIWKYYPDVKASIKLYNKNNVIKDFDNKFKHFSFGFEVKTEVKRINKKEKDYLVNKLGLNPLYVDFINSTIAGPQDSEHGFVEEFDYEDLWSKKTFYEVIFLSKFNEHLHKDMRFLERKIFQIGFDNIHKFVKKNDITEFGTRRRISKNHQFRILNGLKRKGVNVKTSNVLWSYQNNTIPVGTIAHELFMAQQALAPDDLYGFVKNWIEFIKDKNKTFGTNYKIILLTDTWGTDHFIQHFDKSLLEDIDGFRHDSGCPYKWMKRMSDYISGIDKSFDFIFSDTLTPQKVSEIRTYYPNLEIGGIPNYQKHYAVGSYITNNYFGVLPFVGPQMTIKLDTVNGEQVKKISDDVSKST